MDANTMVKVSSADSSPTRQLAELTRTTLAVFLPGRHYSAQAVIRELRASGLRFSDARIRDAIDELVAQGLIEFTGRRTRRPYVLTQAGRDVHASVGISSSSPAHARGKAEKISDYFKKYAIGPFNCSTCGFEFHLSTRWTRRHPPLIHCPYCTRELELPLEEVARASVSLPRPENGGAGAMPLPTAPIVSGGSSTNPSASRS